MRGKIHPPSPVVCLVILKVKVLLSLYAHFVVLGLAIETVNQHSQFGYQAIRGTENMRYIKDWITFWTFTVTLTTSIYFLHKTFQLMMMYRPIKLVCSKINSSVDTVETVIFDYTSPHCDLELGDSKPLFLHDTLAQDDASQYQVWLQNVRQLSSRWTVTWNLNISCFPDLDHNRAIQSFH